MMYQMGQKLGNYELVRLLGSGGFAEVYLGRHIYLDTQAAIKVLQIQLTEQVMQDFLKEARIIANLEHPNIVRVLEFGIEQQRPYLVMNYAPEGTLRQHYPRGRQFAPATVLALLQQIVAALDYAHARKIIHRDVKPENMLLGANNTLLLSDFGLALEGHSSSYSQPANQAGTMLYMAPEQFRGHPCAASDQYALGIVVYEWLSGNVPFAGEGLAVAVQHAYDTPVPLHERVPALPVSLSNVVMRTLQKEPGARFAQIHEFATAFAEACHTHATLFSIAEAAHPLSAALVEAQSAHISADTIARISASGAHDTGRTLPFDSQLPSPAIANSVRTDGEKAAELNVGGTVEEGTQAVTLEIMQNNKSAAQRSSITSSLTAHPRRRRSRGHALLYGLGALGLALCLSGFWAIQARETPSTSHRPTPHDSARVIRTLPPTRPNTRQNRPSSTAKPVTPDHPPLQALNAISQPATHMPPTTPVAGLRHATPHAASPTGVPVVHHTPVASYSPTPIHHNRSLSVRIVGVPEIVQNGSDIAVRVATSCGNCRIRLRVIYSNSSQPFSSQLTDTDSMGEGMIMWNVRVSGQGLIKYTFASLIVTVYDNDERSAFSLPVIVQIV